MVRLWLAAGLLLATGLVGCGSKNPYEQKAQSIVEAMAQGNWQTAKEYYKEISPSVQAAGITPERQMEEGWAAVTSTCGQFERVVKVKQRKNPAGVTDNFVWVTCKFSRGEYVLGVSFDDHDKISGFGEMPKL